MRVLYGIFLSIELISIIIFSYRKTRDFFSPMCIFGYFTFIKYVPHMFYTDYESYTQLNDETLFPTFIYVSIFILSVFLFYLIFAKTIINQAFIRISKFHFSKILVVLVFLIGLGSRLLLIRKIGGLGYVLSNPGVAYYEMTQSSGYLGSLGFFMTIGIVMQVQNIAYSKKRTDYFLLFLMLALGMGTYLVFSSRSPALEMLMITIFAYHYLVKKIKARNIFNLRTIVFALMIAAIIVVLPRIRSNSQLYGDSKITLNLSDSFLSLFDEFSVVGRDTFVFNHFNSSNYWLGSNYLNIFTAWIPSSIVPNKTCIDDGVYLANLMHNFDCLPSFGRNDLVVTWSVPFTSCGIAFTNFGIIGVILGAFLLGFLYSKTYKVLCLKKNFFTLILYQLIVYQFDLSTLGFSQTIIPAILIALIYLVSTKIIPAKSNKKNSSNNISYQNIL